MIKIGIIIIICTWEVAIKPLISWIINSFINFIENKDER